MPVTQLAPPLWLLHLGPWQAYLWRDPDGVTLVDSGAANTVPALHAALAALGLAPSDVDRLVLTHWHEDHTGGAAALPETVEVVAAAADAPVVRGERPGAPADLSDAERALHAQVAADLPGAPPCRVDREVADGDVLDLGGGALVVATPGHTDGSIALLLPRHGVLFTGDTAAEHEGRLLLGPFNVDRDRAAGSFRALAGLDAGTACFGHGAPVVGGAAGALRAAAEDLLVL